jgi:L-serine dehydratase
MLSVLDLFRVGIGPSSSHTVGPMRIAARFLAHLGKNGLTTRTARIRIELQGSLALTGEGHGTPRATLLGLLGHLPETVDMSQAEADLAALQATHRLALPGGQTIAFDPASNVVLAYDAMPTLHPNGMRCQAFDADGAVLADRDYYSTGGGFIASARQLTRPAADDRVASGFAAPYPFGSGDELLALTAAHDLSIADVMLANEDAQRPRADTEARLDAIAAVMLDCVARGLVTEGLLPGKLGVQRRAAALWRKLDGAPLSNERESLFDWLNAYAMAVNEENAAGGQVVTAPTNGAAGIIPAIIRYYCVDGERPARDIRTFLLTAGGIGLLYKQRASISGAEMGCQGEVGVACSMAAAGLAAIWGATPEQVTIAAEIGMEHNLGLTCDPVGGLVQVPCIERNAIGAVKAANAARLALHSVGPMRVSLDQVIETMRQTGLDMSSKYKETSQGGLAVNVVEC